MTRFRDILRTMHRDVHSHMHVPALYIAALGTDPIGPIGVRNHANFEALGPHGDRSDGYADRVEFVPSLIFSREELAEHAITLARLAIVSVEPGEAYRIDYVFPADGDRVKVQVTRLSASDAAGLPVPETA